MKVIIITSRGFADVNAVLYAMALSGFIFDEIVLDKPNPLIEEFALEVNVPIHCQDINNIDDIVNNDVEGLLVVCKDSCRQTKRVIDIAKEAMIDICIYNPLSAKAIEEAKIRRRVSGAIY